MNMEQLQKENDELKAHIERLRDFIQYAQVSSGVCMCGDYMSSHGDPFNVWHTSVDIWDYSKDSILNETPVQSINHIKAQVEEETIERCAKQALAVNARILGKQIKCLPRKYSNQPETVAKDGE